MYLTARDHMGRADGPQRSASQAGQGGGCWSRCGEAYGRSQCLDWKSGGIKEQLTIPTVV